MAPTTPGQPGLTVRSKAIVPQGRRALEGICRYQPRGLSAPVVAPLRTSMRRSMGSCVQGTQASDDTSAILSVVCSGFPSTPLHTLLPLPHVIGLGVLVLDD